MAKTSGFNLADALASVNVPIVGTGREQIEYVNIGLLDADEKNFYELASIDDLAANIELVGLQQPLRIRPNSEQAGRFIIVSGHRRFAALSQLAQDDPAKWSEVPCIKETPASSPELQELRLIYANSDIRRMKDADIAAQAARVEALLYALKEQGVEFPGRMRDHVAEACKVSKSKLSRLKVIRDGLIPELLEKWGKAKLNESVAYALAQLPQDFQRRMLKADSKLAECTARDIERVTQQRERGATWEPTQRCEVYGACTRGDAFLRRDLRRDSWDESCGGNKCCLTCSNGANSTYNPCEQMCPIAQKKRACASQAEKLKAEQREAKEREKLLKAISESVKRFIVAADAVKLPEDAKLEFSSSWGGTFSLSELRQIAEGTYADGDGYNAKLRYNKFTAENMQHPEKLAKLLHCSTDYLLGLTDELSPARDSKQNPSGVFSALAEDARDGWVQLSWKAGTPETPCKAVGKFRIDEKTVLERIVRWDGSRWSFGAGADVACECVGWFPIPED